ncbi:MAG: hypothetical protein U0Q16_08735 [Bryobacteraceae bacterium]
MRPHKRRTHAPPKALELSKDIYRSLGVRPFINCRGALTVIGGSMELPEVRAAKDLANQHFVQLDELMEAVGKRSANHGRMGHGQFRMRGGDVACNCRLCRKRNPISTCASRISCGFANQTK